MSAIGDGHADFAWDGTLNGTKAPSPEPHFAFPDVETRTEPHISLPIDGASTGLVNTNARLPDLNAVFERNRNLLSTHAHLGRLNHGDPQLEMLRSNAKPAFGARTLSAQIGGDFVPNGDGTVSPGWLFATQGTQNPNGRNPPPPLYADLDAIDPVAPHPYDEEEEARRYAGQSGPLQVGPDGNFMLRNARYRLPTPVPQPNAGEKRRRSDSPDMAMKSPRTTNISPRRRTSSGDKHPHFNPVGQSLSGLPTDGILPTEPVFGLAGPNHTAAGEPMHHAFVDNEPIAPIPRYTFHEETRAMGDALFGQQHDGHGGQVELSRAEQEKANDELFDEFFNDNIKEIYGTNSYDTGASTSLAPPDGQGAMKGQASFSEQVASLDDIFPPEEELLSDEQVALIEQTSSDEQTSSGGAFSSAALAPFHL